MSRTRWTLETIIEKLAILNPNILILSKNYKDNNTILECKCTVDGCIFYISWKSLVKCPKCPMCSKTSKYNIDIAIKKCKDISPSINILSDKYTNSNEKVGCECTICGHIFTKAWVKLFRGQGCPNCINNRRDYTIDIIRAKNVLINPNTEILSEEYVSSGKKLKCKCLICGNIFEKSWSNLNRGKGCSYCSDNISIPEKFMMQTLIFLNIDFITQYSPKWAESKRYDFYIPSLNIIIETHGGQHYRNTSWGSLESIQKNDLLKYNLAIKNGISTESYIVINCKESNNSWLSKNFTESLSDVFNLEKIDWDSIYSNSMSLISVKIWDMYTQGYSIKDICECLKIGDYSVRQYLHKGNELGKIIYTPKNQNRETE